jgi:molybdate transport system substrate-binding protein
MSKALAALLALVVSVAVFARTPVIASARHPIAAQRPGEVLVFAAASLQDALNALVEPARQSTGVRMRVSYASSSALARQIENGAPAGLFISADLEWMDYLAQRKLVHVSSRVNLAGNRLVLIAPRSEPLSLRIGPGFPLAAALGSNRLALGNPDAVPAGRYAKAALTALGVWDSVAGKIAPAETVRAALILVARGEARLGIVYATDAKVEPGVVVVDTFSDMLHPPIVYPAALLPNASADARKLLEFLRSEAALNVFRAQGFTTAPRSATYAAYD